MVMKKAFIVLLLMACFSLSLFSQQALDELHVHDGEKTLHLLMSVSEVYLLLGEPCEVKRVESTRPYHQYDRITLEYPGITFIYDEYKEDPPILVIGFGAKNLKLGSHYIIGASIKDVENKFGNPYSTETTSEFVYYRYEFWLSSVENIILQFRFNALGICNGVVLTHSSLTV